jgi:dihydroxyacid dehydratase/phosphogluconate dehydratase
MLLVSTFPPSGYRRSHVKGWRNREIGSGSDVALLGWLRAGCISDEEFCEIELFVTSAGHCMTMGTASTMTSVVEALGMTLTGCASVPAADSRRYVVAEQSGARIVEMVREDLRPTKLLTRKAIENGITVDMAIGGSTNAIIHFLAFAGRLGMDLPMSLFDEISPHAVSCQRPAIGKILDGRLLLCWRPAGAMKIESSCIWT